MALPQDNVYLRNVNVFSQWNPAVCMKYDDGKQVIETDIRIALRVLHGRNKR